MKSMMVLMVGFLAIVLVGCPTNSGPVTLVPEVQPSQTVTTGKIVIKGNLFDDIAVAAEMEKNVEKGGGYMPLDDASTSVVDEMLRHKIYKISVYIIGKAYERTVEGPVSDGQYSLTIENVPPGQYNIAVSCVEAGFNGDEFFPFVQKGDITVNIGQTTFFNCRFYDGYYAADFSISGYAGGVVNQVLLNGNDSMFVVDANTGMINCHVWLYAAFAGGLLTVINEQGMSDSIEIYFSYFDLARGRTLSYAWPTTGTIAVDLSFGYARPASVDIIQQDDQPNTVVAVSLGEQSLDLLVPGYMPGITRLAIFASDGANKSGYILDIKPGQTVATAFIGKTWTSMCLFYSNDDSGWQPLNLDQWFATINGEPLLADFHQGFYGWWWILPTSTVPVE